MWSRRFERVSKKYAWFSISEGQTSIAIVMTKPAETALSRSNERKHSQ
jgi:hypothetical protein